MIRSVDENSINLGLNVFRAFPPPRILDFEDVRHRAIVLWNERWNIDQELSIVRANHPHLREHCPRVGAFRIISFFGEEEPTMEDALAVWNLVPMSQALLRPRSDRDWEMVTHHLGARMNNETLRHLYFDDRRNGMTLLEYSVTMWQLGIECPTPITFLRMWKANQIIPTTIPLGVCHICCNMAEGEYRYFESIIKLGSAFHRVSIFVAGPGRHINTCEDVIDIENKYCGKVLDYGHAYTVTIWDQDTDVELLLMRVLRIEFRICRNHLLDIDDNRMDDYRNVLRIFMSTCDLSRKTMNIIYRIISIYSENFERLDLVNDHQRF